MIKGETLGSGASQFCCGRRLALDVCRSAAGYYVGTVCGVCQMPYSRESVYYPTADDVARHIEGASWVSR